MKKYLLLMSCAFGLLCIPARAEEEETPLGKQMEAMNDAYKAFKSETDPVKGATQAREAQQSALRSALEMPEIFKTMPDGPEKAKQILEFRKMIGKLFVVFCEVEEAFVAGKVDEVAKLIVGIKELKKTGHDKFMKDE